MDGRSASSEASESSASQLENDQHVNNASPHDKKPGSHSAAGETNHNNEHAAVSDNNLAEIVWALKEKIAGLEDQLHGGNESIQQPPEMSEEERQHRRSERYLYKHRKEWEKKPHGQLSMYNWIRHEAHNPDYRFGPWKYTWGVNPSPLKGPYHRPDPFNLPNKDDQGSEDGEEDEDSPDEFDRNVIYADRRDTLRKTFEWEMDRLWLAEEFERRRKNRLAEAKRRKEQKKVDKANALKAEARENPETFVDVTKLNHVEWPAFKAIATANELHPHVIDILIGDPAINESNASPRWMDLLLGGRKSQAAKTATQATATAHAAPKPPPGHGQLPERIRLHSNSVMTIITRILGGWPLQTRDGSGLVLLRPFKTLEYCEAALREWSTTLEAKLLQKSSGVEAAVQDSKPAPGDASATEISAEAVSRDQETSNINIDDKKNDTHHDTTDEQASGSLEGDAKKLDPRTSIASNEDRPSRESSNDDDDSNEPANKGEADSDNDITQSDTALVQLKCLLKFIDTDIAPRRNRLLEPECRKVFFSDLWGLFRPGVDVIGSDGRQAYRVINVFTARHDFDDDDLWFDSALFRNRLKKKQNDDSSDDEEDENWVADLTLTCVYIDFDGQHVGPVLKKFEFKRYDGEKDVSSLEVYPLRYHPVDGSDFRGSGELPQEQGPVDSDSLRQKLIARGTVFLSVVGGKHMYYSGPTLDVREEVESQVMIDFETAFSAEENKDIIQRPELEVLAGRDWSNANKAGGAPIDCNTCCAGEAVYNEHHIDGKQSKEYVDGLLPKQGTQQVPSIAIVPRSLKNLQAIGSVNGYSVSDDELLIMSYRVFGFVLRSRKWATLDLTYLSDVQPSGHLGDNSPDSNVTPAGEGREKKGKSLNAFDRLVLPDGHRRTIKSLIAQHFYDKGSKSAASEQVDIVRGKGKGLIMLLHGAPGVGKTSTAEGVAELFKKPLFQITCGDLGTTAKEVEKALETNFALASRWGCILLLDEADVFLAERTKEDFKRNGLVAVFLRVLEYYSGILFLTTNRVGDFDEAFASRIHISLHYPPLNEKNTLDVFQMNLELIKERFSRQGRSIDIDIWGVSSFATSHFREQPKARWNGRQIRNACQTALALAEFEAQGSSHEAIYRPEAAVKLTVEHFDTVRKAYLEFAEYMTDLYGSDAARRAKEGRLRAKETDENERRIGSGGREDFLRDVHTPLGGGPGRGPPSQYSSFNHSPQQQQSFGRQGYPYQQQQQQQQQQGYNYNLSPGFQPQQQQTPRSTTTPQAYQQQHDVSQQRQSQEFTGAVRHDRNPSQTHPPSRQGDFFQPTVARQEPFQYREPDGDPAREFGEDLSQTPPSMQRPRAGDGRQPGPQDAEEAAGRYQWSGQGRPGI